jgi:hypothetical protein
MFKNFDVEELFIEDGFGRLKPNPKHHSKYEEYPEGKLIVSAKDGSLKANPKFENNKKFKESEREF